MLFIFLPSGRFSIVVSVIILFCLLNCSMLHEKENFKAILCTNGYIHIRCFSLHLGSPPVANQDMGKMHSR